MSRRLIVWGASGHGRVVADAARAAGWQLAGWIDGDPAKGGARIDDAPVLGATLEEAAAAAESHAAALVVAVGDNRTRARLWADIEAAGLTAATVVHPAAVVSPRAEVGAGSVLCAGAVVNPGARLGRNVIVNTGATVDHDCRLGDHVHLSPGVHLGGTVTIGEGAHLGVGVSVRNDLAIGAWTVVGAGAAVVAPLPERVLAYGVPARVVRSLDDDGEERGGEERGGEERGEDRR